MRTFLALLAVVALAGCRSSRDRIDPSVQTSVTNTPAATVPADPNNTTATAAEGKGTMPQSAGLPTPIDNPPMASAAPEPAPASTTTTTTTKHKKVRKD